MENVKTNTKAIPSKVFIILVSLFLIAVLWVARDIVVGVGLILLAVVLGGYLLLKTGSMILSILITLVLASTKLVSFILAVGIIVWILSFI